MASGGLQFRAFISYSHRDKRWASWLHRALETYRVPRHLVGRETSAGLVGSRIGKIFRDRDELAVSADLFGEINEALKNTQFLVVLCSPASAKSEWVNQEIINFKRLKGDSSIICMIADGEPYASLKPGMEDQECFAPALRYQVKADGTLSDIPAEPVAADLRPHADGKRRAKLKVIAGLLDVGLDELVQRENQRRQRRMAVVSAASVAGMVVMTGLTWNAITAQNLAEDRRGQSEGLVEFMIEDLRHPLEEVGRLDAFEKVIDQTLEYYEAQDLASAPDETVGRWARALQFAAGVKFQLGENAEAYSNAIKAHDVTLELVTRNPANLERMNEHGQSKFWLGQIEYADGYFQKASTSMWSYLNIAKEIAHLDYNNVEYLTNAGRAAYSYGGVLIKLNDSDKAIIQFELANSYWQTLERIIPGNEEVDLDRTFTNRWLAEALEKQGQLERALAIQRRNLSKFRKFHETYPDDKDFEFALVQALHRLALSESKIGDRAASDSQIREALARIRQLQDFDSTNQQWGATADKIEKDFASIAASQEDS